MQQALYRKYRSKTFKDVLGQKHITNTLQRAIDSGQVSHAYLFTGPHGVGKTSVARILAHAITKLPYDGTSHLDIIEIDAASNRRIDEIRDLRDKARISPISASHKVYIIDEVHMLTNEAFNALLKTLEEPPEHVIFILATTEAHKLPETIISRTQRFGFLPISSEVVIGHLQTIAKKEKIKITDDAVTVLAGHAHGSFRDAISLIDQVAMSDSAEITVEAVESLLGIASNVQIASLLTAVTEGNTASCIEQLSALSSQGFSPSIISHQLIQAAYSTVAASPSRSMLELIEQLLEVNHSTMPERKLEVIVLRTCLENDARQQPEPARQSVPEKATARATATKPVPPISSDKPSPTSHGSEEPNWALVLQDIKQNNNALSAVLRMSKARLSDGSVELAFKFPFHHKRAEQSSNRDVIITAIKKVLGEDMQYEAVIDKTITLDQPDSYQPDQVIENPSEQASSVLDVMGGGEVIAYEDS